MHELDLTGPAPQPKTLAEAQQIINGLWQSQQELLLRQRELQAQIEPLKEQLHSDSRDSSKPPSSDSFNAHKNGLFRNFAESRLWQR